MGSRRLRAFLVEIALAAMPALPACCPSPDVSSATKTADTRDLSLVPAIKPCIDHDACDSLCMKLLARDGVANVYELYFDECRIVSAHDTYLDLSMKYYEPIECEAGRRTDGCAAPAKIRAASAGAAYFVAQARLEAEAVHAFARMIRELRAHGAPSSLITRASKAREDEIRHARVVARMARDAGGSVEPVAAPPMHVRDLRAVAIENMIEGCVRETHAAAVVTHQALATRSATWASIARDEIDHAALAADAAAWMHARLGPSARRAIDRARANAIDELIAHARPFARALFAA
ncbi:MAG TPA: hypothetical protein VL463_07905 [Kofleriaceae bacterium]|nr:hypothetical protein [Kofleriaceae bacterium]